MVLTSSPRALCYPVIPCEFRSKHNPLVYHIILGVFKISSIISKLEFLWGRLYTYHLVGNYSLFAYEELDFIIVRLHYCSCLMLPHCNFSFYLLIFLLLL